MSSVPQSPEAVKTKTLANSDEPFDAHFDALRKSWRTSDYGENSSADVGEESVHVHSGMAL